MSFLNPIFRGISIETPPYLSGGGICGRTMLLGLPLLALVLFAVFLYLGLSVKSVVDRAVVRNAQMQALSTAFALERILDDARDNLLLLASRQVRRETLEQWLKYHTQFGENSFCEAAFMGLAPADRYIMLNLDGCIVSVSPDASRYAQGAPLQEHMEVRGRERSGVSISRPMEVIYPMLKVNESPQNVALKILRFSTPVYDKDQNLTGILSISLDLRALRDRMSSISHIDGDESVQSFFFDEDGWMLFQAEDDASPGKPLSPDLARTGLRGDFGRSGFNTAFRPEASHLNYWTIVADVQNMRSGVLREPVAAVGSHADQRLGAGASYAPVVFQPDPGHKPQVVGGVALLDDACSPLASGRVLCGIFLMAFVPAFSIMALLLWLLARLYSRQIKTICGQIESRNAGDTTEALPVCRLPLEFEQLRSGLNTLLGRLEHAQAARKSHTAARNRQWLRRPALNLPDMPAMHASVLVGEAPPMLILYEQIRKAAQTSADVLVIGETGTGKELVASAIHRLSSRSGGPFISINCGALDEGLLMDTLFGHMKGAFTEAKSERKGAFLSAGGGTLLLDEIGNAAPKVQQALLRALSTRSIRPLGSDIDIPFDTRIIAATNASLIGGGQDFRADLYYRLAVIKIATPPLRGRLEDIPLLVVYFLAQAAREKGSSVPAISHGALEKLKSYAWPGNVRELKNVITRAMAFFDGKLIQAEDVQIENDPEISSGDLGNELANAMRPGRDGAVPAAAGRGLNPLSKLNARQRALWDALADGGSISRQEYQRLSSEEISSRTAQYDLKFMVGLGLLRSLGRGPSQRYAAVMPERTSRVGQLNQA